jgi:hypothetical protein
MLLVKLKSFVLIFNFVEKEEKTFFFDSAQNCGPQEARTPHLLGANEALYQMS